MAILEGRIAGKRQAELLQVFGCKCQKCTFSGDHDCLIGREIEGRW